MIERVARGRITVPAAAALGAVSAGLLVASPALAGGQGTTLQMRVEVVEPCSIRVLPGGGLDQSCGGGQLPTQISMGDLIAGFNDRAAAHFGSFPTVPVAAPASPPAMPAMPTMPAMSTPAMPTLAPLPVPATLTVEAQDRVAAAGARANEVAMTIAQRVRHITIAF